MIKLFTLKDLSAFAADTVFKICLKLESYGFSEDNIVEFDSYNDLYKNVLDAMENGENIIVAGDNSDYCDIKKELISRLILQEHSCSKISECIAVNAGDDIAEIDMSAHCLVPVNSINHLSVDGLYSGFTTKVLNGQLTVFPLDFSRIDKILESLISDIFEKNLLEEPENEESEENQSTVAYDFTPSVSKMIYSLSQLDKTLSLATSEAVMWVYGLYEQISGIAETVNFVEVVDEEVEGYDDQEPESESSIVVRHSREAMYNMNSDFGGSISDVYALEKEDGSTEYFAFVAVCDRVSARVKKIKTSNVEDLGILLSHCVVMLSETICQKADAISLSLSKVYDVTDDEEDEDGADADEIDIRDIPKNKLNLMIAGLVCAILVPIILTFIFATEDATIPTLASTSTTFSYDYLTSTTVDTATTLFPGVTESTTTSIFSDDALLPSEDAATEVSAATTEAAVESESGVFTFTVFGYGHGVGLSQEGANYYASEGWNYAEILAMYYYGATLVSGDAYPETITYAGSTYETREYLASALASEMSSDFSSEAQKAQVVAIYTFAKYYDYNVSSTGHAFGKTATEAQYAIVDEVMSGGLYISYNGSTALTPFHAISAGATTSYYNTWGSYNVTYLSGGRPSYGDTLVDDFQTTYSVTTEDFKTMVIEALGIELTGDPSTWITILTHDACVSSDIGYVATMSVGGQTITGNEFRTSVLDGNIRSHCFALTYTPDV
ncbi:MAG: SpoIID/LytB domain-containing protein [Clostridia bacterium]